MLQCPECGNTRAWRNAVSNRNGTSAECGNCGHQVSDATVTSRIEVRIAQTDSTTFGSGLSETNEF